LLKKATILLREAQVSKENYIKGHDNC